MLVGVLIALLSLAPRPHAVDRAYRYMQELLETNAPLTASASLAEVAEAIPWLHELRLTAGRLAIQGGDPATAIQLLEQYADEFGLSREDQIALGDAYMETGNVPGAVAIWEEILQSDRANPGLHIRLAQYYRSQGDYEATISHLQAVLSSDPGNAQLHYQLGLIFSVVESEAALAYLTQAAALDPDLADSAQEMVRRINTARLADEPAYTYVAIGRVLASLGEWELAVEAFRQAGSARPDYAEAWAFLGEALQHLDQDMRIPDRQDGLQELQRALELDPTSIAANVFMGLYFQRHERHDLALAHLQYAAEQSPQNPVMRVELGNTLAAMGDLPAAQVYYEQAIELAPSDPTYWRMLAEFCLRHQIQVRQVALPAARQAVMLAPNDVQGLDVLGETLLLLGDNLNAERFLRRALESNPDYAPAHLHLGMVYLFQGDTQEARSEFARAETLAPAGTWTADQAQRLMNLYFP